MQVRIDLTPEELNVDPLSFACHPLGQLKMISDMLCSLHVDPRDKPFPDFSAESVYAMRSVIADSVKDLEYLIEVVQAHQRG